MKIRYLGTGAYEGVPSLFCNCRVCTESRAKGGRNMRSRSQAIVNDELLLDFNADTVWHSHRYGLDWSKIGDCLITHSHCDHLYVDDVDMASAAYSHEHRTLNFYAGKSGYEKLAAFADRPNSGVTATLIAAGKGFVTSSGYDVMPMNADHDPHTSPLVFSIAKGGKRMLYAHDTGYFGDDTWALLGGEGRFDLVSLDCTGCVGYGGEWRRGHMTFGTVSEVVDRLKKMGAVDGNTTVVVNHFSHNGGQTYDEMSAYSEKFGIITSFDGMEIEF